MLTEAQERYTLQPHFVREDLRGRSPEEVREVGRAFAAASRLADLEADPAFHEQMLADALDLATGVTREEPVAAVREYSASDESQLQREFDLYTKVLHDPRRACAAPAGRAPAPEGAGVLVASRPKPHRPRVTAARSAGSGSSGPSTLADCR